METPKTKIQQLVADYKAPTPWIYRRIGDFALLMVPIILTTLLGIPDKFINPDTKIWIAFAHSLITTGFKIWMNLQKEPNDAVQVMDPDHPTS